MTNKNFYPKPTKSNLQINGELIKIEVFHTSFHVHYQFPTVNGPAVCMDVFCSIYPIRCLQDFFAVNAKLDSKYIARRPQSLMSPPKGLTSPKSDR
jgi:hypothetical protein